MITNRELNMEDYLAIVRRQMWVVIIPAVICLLLGFLSSYRLPPLYTSYSLLLVEPQVLPTGYVKPIVTERLRDRIITMQQNVLNRNRLQSLVSRLGLVKNGKTEDEVIDRIRLYVRITEADPYAPPPSGRSAPPPGRGFYDVDFNGFYVEYTADNPGDAQLVCNEITSMLLAENLEMRQKAAQSTTDFLARQLQQAKQNLDEIERKMSEFKEQHRGQLPSDQDTNLKILMGLTSQLEASTQNVSRAQQDKAYVQEELDKEVVALRAYEETPNLPTLRQRVLSLQAQLIEMQTRYTQNHPDIAKTERDIEELKKKIKELNANPDSGDAPEAMRAKLDPPQLHALRDQIRQIDLGIDRAAEHQKRLQQAIDSYQARIAVSPEIEQEWKQLTRDTDTARGIYNNLLFNESTAKMQTDMEQNQEGEQVRLIEPATLPLMPSFPNRKKFAVTGLAAGLGLGLCFGFWRELKDKSMRNERDVLAALELPMLAAVPWVGNGVRTAASHHFSLVGEKDHPEL